MSSRLSSAGPWAAAAAACALLAAPSAAQVPSLDWTILKPSNTGIPGDYGEEVFIDQDDRPWLTGRSLFYQEGGAGRWDEATNTWSALSNADFPAIPSERFEDIDADASGRMWIATVEGLFSYDPAVGESSIQVWDKTNSPMPNNWVRDLSIAPDGTIWLAIDDNTAPLGGLVQFDPAASTWNVWTTANGLPWGAQWPGWDWIDYVAAAPDDDGGYTVYFGSPEMGAATYKDGVWVSYNLAPPPGPVVWGLPGGDVVDELGNTWLSTDQGLMRRTPDGALTPVPVPASGRLEAFPGGRAGLATSQGQVWYYDGVAWSDLGFWGATLTAALAQEASGEIWVVGNAGAARYENGAWQRYRMTNTGMVGRGVQTIDFDAAGNVYMNGNAGPGVGGFSIYDGQRWTCVNDLNYGLGPVWGQSSDDVDRLCVRSDGTVAMYVGVEGLKIWDGVGYEEIGPAWTTHYEIAEDGLGRLWSGGWGKLYRYDVGGTVTFDTTNSPMLDFRVEALVADETLPGWVWAGTPIGVVHTNGADWNVYPIQVFATVDDVLLDVEPDTDGSFWVGTTAGVFHYDPATAAVQQYLPATSGLPSDDIHHLEVAPDGTVWASSFDDEYPYPGGLSRFDGTEWVTWDTGNSPLPHNQHHSLTSRATATGYEVWVGTAGDGVAVVSVDTSGVICQPNLGFGGPGTATLSVCGQALTPGNSASLDLAGAAPSAPAWLVWGFAQGALPLAGGTLVPSPPFLAGPLSTDASGAIQLPITNTFGALDIYAQYAIVDLALPQLIALSNAVKIEFLP